MVARSAFRCAGKFGAAPGEAIRLLRETAAAGLSAEGVAFHVGSQQTRPAAYAEAARQALAVAGAAGLRRPVLNVGGGFPVPYRSPVPDLSSFATAIDAAVRTAVRTGVVEGVDLMVEPGRAVAAEAGYLSVRPSTSMISAIFLRCSCLLPLAMACSTQWPT